MQGGDVSDGYYWVRCSSDLTNHVALLENNMWYVPGVEESVEIDELDILGPVKRLDH
jgi:hypothetical protein